MDTDTARWVSVVGACVIFPIASIFLMKQMALSSIENKSWKDAGGIKREEE